MDKPYSNNGLPISRGDPSIPPVRRNMTMCRAYVRLLHNVIHSSIM